MEMLPPDCQKGHGPRMSGRRRRRRREPVLPDSFARNEAVISNQWRESTASVFVVHSQPGGRERYQDLSKVDEAVERLVKSQRRPSRNPDYAGSRRDRSGTRARVRIRRSSPCTKAASMWRPPSAGRSIRARRSARARSGNTRTGHFLATFETARRHDHLANLLLSIRALVSLESSGHGIAVVDARPIPPEKAGQKAGILRPWRDAEAGKAGRYTVVSIP